MVPTADETIGAPDREIETLVDHIILRRRRGQIESIDHALQLVASASYTEYFKMMLINPELCPSKKIEVSPAKLGSYLSSRLSLHRVEFTNGNIDCMYSLADAVKASSPIDILRWRFVLSNLTKAISKNSFEKQLLNQTTKVLKC